jgi:putative transposase
MAEIRQELLEELLADYEKPEDLVGPDGLLRDLFKRLIETAAGAELTEHLGYERGDPAGRGSGDNRNGTTSKTLVTEHGDVTVDMPRDRESSFEPRIVAKGQTHWHGFDDKIISMYAGGMTYEEIRGHLAEIYGVEVSKDFISTVTDQVLEDVRAWQNRPLDACYPIVWIDALVVKIRVDRVVQNRPAYLALGLNLEGKKEALGVWIGAGDGESAKFWLNILTELKGRGVAEVCIVCCDGLTGLADAVESVYGDAWVQCCVVHLIRTSLKHVASKDGHRSSIPTAAKPRLPRPTYVTGGHDKRRRVFRLVRELVTRQFHRGTRRDAFQPPRRAIDRDFLADSARHQLDQQRVQPARGARPLTPELLVALRQQACATRSAAGPPRPARESSATCVAPAPAAASAHVVIRPRDASTSPAAPG